MNEILIIDDNPEILSANEAYLTEKGFGVTAVDTGIKALAALHEKQFDCIVLDVLLPDLDGLTICKAARTVTQAPIIFLTCMDDLDDKVKGLMAGGDDYMTKPYSLRELSVRIFALIRRDEMIRQPQNTGFYIDAHNRMIHTGEGNIFLSEKEFELFMLFFEQPEKVFSKEEIYEQVWKSNRNDLGTVAVHIMKLRRKIKPVERMIGSIDNSYSNGYMLTPPSAEDKQ